MVTRRSQPLLLTADTLIPDRQRMVVVGADGYPEGWVLYSINVQSFATQVEVTHDLASLLRSRPADIAALGIDVPIACSIVHEPVTSQLASCSAFEAVAYSPLQVARRCSRSTIGRRAI
jgi:hypothetical protein